MPYYPSQPLSATGEVSVDVPRTAFGELATAEKTPQVQVKFPAGINPEIAQVLTNKAGSSTTAVDGLCTVTCASTAESFAQIRSKDVIRYGPGQGMDCKFTAGFTTGVANSTQWAGPGDDDEMLAFGYNGTSFGLLHRKMGELEVRTLSVTAGAGTGAGNITITLDGTAVVVAVGNGDTISEVVAAIIAASADVYNAGRGWEMFTADNKSVTFIALVAEATPGTFSAVDTDTTGCTFGTFTQATTDLLGVAPTESITAQASWNIDVCDGTGPSGMTLDPTKINVFDVDFQYLGAGNLFFGIEDLLTGRFAPVHMMRHAGAGSTPTFRNPTFNINLIAKTEAAYSGSALSMITSSLGGFIEGKEAHFGVRHSISTTVSTNGTTEVVNMVLHNQWVFGSTRNKIEVYPDHLTLINESTRSIKVDIYRGVTTMSAPATLAAVNSNTSVMTYAAGSGTRTGGDLLYTTTVSASLSKDLDIEHLNTKIRPGETLVVVVTKSSGGADGNATIGISWLERV